MRQHRQGKLVFIAAEQDITDETLQEIFKNHNRKISKSKSKTLREKFEDEFYNEYIFVQRALYKIEVEIDYTETPDVYEINTLTNGNKSFNISFSDCCQTFEGAVEEAFEDYFD